ncbi:MAG: sensor histidine kinase [Verrucomicrobiae bacterium]|nr:sensor histidine kinase [Verrucomicrobiae bacterium]
MALLWSVPPVVRAQLHTAAEVRSLSAEEADEGKMVDLTAVVTFADAPGTIFIQDETAGTFFRPGQAIPPQPGDEVRVRGKTQPGLYLPGIEDATFEVLGHPGVPEARPVTFDDLMSGRFHYQRVAIEGVVRTIVPEEEGASLVRVALGSRIVEVQVEQPPSGDEDWIDSRVRVAGLAAGHINARRQLVAPYLRCADWTAFTRLQPGREPETTSLLSPEQLLNFDVDGQGGHRVRVRGTVLAAFPRGEIFLRDEASAVAVRLKPDISAPAIGDRVEVMGFPQMDRFSASLADAEILVLEPGAAGDVAPLPVSFSELMDGAEDGNLVSIEAALVDRYRTESGGVLVLQVGRQTVQARVPSLPEAMLTGTQLRVTGICQVESIRGSEYRSTPASVSLRVRNANDIEVLGAPSWWTARRLGTVLVVLLVAMTLAALWIILLRRQVIHQTVALRHRIEHEAALEERQRIAREFHDTLEQELAGLSLRLDAAVATGGEGKLRGLLEGSRSLVSRIQTETRNLVSDLRDDGDDESLSLEGALGELAARQPADLGPEIRFEAASPTPLSNLPPRTVHHLKMIAREAVANALKHAQASRIDLILDGDDEATVMKVVDDGRGFDTEGETRGKSGHFGCMGIRERCARIGATVDWRSAPGGGTTLEVRLPVADKDALVGRPT